MSGHPVFGGEQAVGLLESDEARHLAYGRRRRIERSRAQDLDQVLYGS